MARGYQCVRLTASFGRAPPTPAPGAAPADRWWMAIRYSSRGRFIRSCRFQPRLPEGGLEQFSRLLDRLEGPSAMKHAYSKAGAEEGPATLAPFHVAVAKLRPKKPDIVAAVVVDKQHSAAVTPGRRAAVTPGRRAAV